MKPNCQRICKFVFVKKGSLRSGSIRRFSEILYTCVCVCVFNIVLASIVKISVWVLMFVRFTDNSPVTVYLTPYKQVTL